VTFVTNLEKLQTVSLGFPRFLSQKKETSDV
jgi:hypothetical protein